MYLVVVASECLQHNLSDKGLRNNLFSRQNEVEAVLSVNMRTLVLPRQTNPKPTQNQPMAGLNPAASQYSATCWTNDRYRRSST